MKQYAIQKQVSWGDLMGNDSLRPQNKLKKLPHGWERALVLWALIIGVETTPKPGEPGFRK